MKNNNSKKFSCNSIENNFSFNFNKKIIKSILIIFSIGLFVRFTISYLFDTNLLSNCVEIVFGLGFMFSIVALSGEGFSGDLVFKFGGDSFNKEFSHVPRVSNPKRSFGSAGLNALYNKDVVDSPNKESLYIKLKRRVIYHFFEKDLNKEISYKEYKYHATSSNVCRLNRNLSSDLSALKNRFYRK